MNTKATGIIKKHVMWSVGAGVVPVPLFDLAAVTAIQYDMLRQLAEHYEVDYSLAKGKTFVSALTGGTFARLAASLVKAIPGVGSIIGGLSMPVLAGASTWAVGQVATGYFESGLSLEDVDFAEAKEAYDEAFDKGTEEAKRAKKQAPKTKPVTKEPARKKTAKKTVKKAATPRTSRSRPESD